MTTKNSPLRLLRAQAEQIAKALKDPATPGMSAARLKSVFKTALVMDDKVITIEMSWGLVDQTTEPALAEYILKLMREANDAAH